MSKLKVAIIGGGASGVTSALLLQDTYDVTIFERENDLLLKLLKTGNGKANIFNRGIKLDDYNDQAFMKNHYACIEPTVEDLFNILRIATYTDNENRVYPFSRSARGLKILFETALKARVKLNTKVESIRAEEDTYLVNGKHFDYVIIATGSSAGFFKRNISNDNEELFNTSKLHVSSFTPVIKTIKVRENLHSIKHERVDALLSLWDGDVLVKEDRGEILFKEDGLSGIVSFVISSYFEWASKSSKDLHLTIDFMPDHDEATVRTLIKSADDFQRVFAPRIASFLSKGNVKDKVSLVKKYRLTPISGNYPENTQAMHGGVKLSQINKYFNVKNAPNLFVLGEALNIDGICGGYNLGFAFYSAVVVSNYLLDKLSK